MSEELEAGHLEVGPEVGEVSESRIERVVIEALKEAGIRQDIIVLVGGAPLNEAFAEEIEADAYCRDAAVGVETAKKFMYIRRQKAMAKG